MSCAIETTARFRKSIPDGQHADVVTTLTAMQDGFGQPHVHSGLGIRKLRKNIFECRTGLGLRLVFAANKGVLTFDLAGNHDQVQTYLRNR
jgi:hypothetical protein